MERRGEIIPALADPHLRLAVFAQGAGEARGDVDIGIAAIAYAPVPRADAADGNIAAIRLVAEIAAQVGVHRRRIGGIDPVEAGVVIGPFAGVVVILAGVAGIEAADGEATVAQQFLVESAGRDAQIGLFQICFRQAGEAGQFLADGGAFGGGQTVPLDQRRDVGAAGKGAGFGGPGFDTGGLVRDLVVIPGGGGIAGQQAHILHLVALILGFQPEIEDGGDEDDAVERDIIILPVQLIGHGGRAGGAIGFAAEELGCVPAVVLVQPQADELRDGLGIAVNAPEVFGIGLAQGMAPAGADRIDKHQIGDIEQRFGVVADVIGRRAVVLGIGDVHPLRAKGTHVQPQAARPRPAVEQEEHRAVRLRIVLQIGGGEDGGSGLALLVLQEGFANQGGVVHLHPAKGAAALGDDPVRSGGGFGGLFGWLVNGLGEGGYSQRSGQRDQRNETSHDILPFDPPDSRQSRGVQSEAFGDAGSMGASAGADFTNLPTPQAPIAAAARPSGDTRRSTNGRATAATLPIGPSCDPETREAIWRLAAAATARTARRASGLAMSRLPLFTSS